MVAGTGLSAVKMRFFTEMLFPRRINHKELRRDRFKQLGQVLLRDATVIVCYDASTRFGQPNLCRPGRRRNLCNMDMDWFTVLVGPQVNNIPAYSEKLRHLISRRFPRTETASAHSALKNL